MAIIYSYPLINTLEDSNLFPVSAINEEDEPYTANVTFSTLALEIIDEAFNGTDRYIPRFDGASSLVNSVIYEDSNGNIGIGTTSPGKTLDVNGNGLRVGASGDLVLDLNSTTGAFSIGDTAELGDGAYINGDSTNIDIVADGGPIVRFTNNGKVGIKTINPQKTLDVNGDARFTGAIDVEGTTFLAGPITCEDSINMTQNGRITNLEDPQDDQDAATKFYVDSQTAGQVSGTGTTNNLPIWSDGPNSVLGDSNLFQESLAGSAFGAIGLNTTKLGTNYGEYPDLRVASRLDNDFAVLDLFRPDSSVVAGDTVGALQYSVDDDGRYAVAQMAVQTLFTSGVGNSGGGKFVFKTSQGNSSGPNSELESRFTLDYSSANFSVPINVTSTEQSSFAGQVTIPETPLAATDAASKAYVDSKSAGQVSGTGTTNTLPIWSDGPNGVLSDSGIQEVRDGQGYISSITISTSKAANPLNINFGTGGTTSFKTGTTEFIKLTNQVNGFYTSSFRYGGKLTVDRDTASRNPSLDVGDADHTYPAAWFRNGVVISNNPSGVQVDNTSMVIGAGNNDNVSGSDHCLIVGSGNQITDNSNQSVAFGQGNTITSSIDSLAVGNSNNINSAQRVYALGFDNTIDSASSFVAGGQNTLENGETNIVVGFDNNSTSGNNFVIGNDLNSSGQKMILGFRNNVSEYPATDPQNGLAEVKFAVATGTTTRLNSNALLITAGGKSGGSPAVPQVPRVILPTVVNFNFADDTAAAAGGIPVGGLYHNAGVIRIRLT